MSIHIEDGWPFPGDWPRLRLTEQGAVRPERKASGDGERRYASLVDACSTLKEQVERLHAERGHWEWRWQELRAGEARLAADRARFSDRLARWRRWRFWRLLLACAGSVLAWEGLGWLVFGGRP